MAFFSFPNVCPDKAEWRKTREGDIIITLNVDSHTALRQQLCPFLAYNLMEHIVNSLISPQLLSIYISGSTNAYNVILCRRSKLKCYAVCNISVTSALHMSANLLLDSNHSYRTQIAGIDVNAADAPPFVENLAAIILTDNFIIKARLPKLTFSHINLSRASFVANLSFYVAKSQRMSCS